ncbi:hypothetical protein MODO_3165 [Myroides odoratimimus]|nr:hypothetical protein MODO_3165 [Myroides odoratimimus]
MNFTTFFISYIYVHFYLCPIVLQSLGLENNELKNWEKACITDLLVNLIKKGNGVQH